MTTEIIFGIIAGTFIVLTVFLILTLVRLRKTLKKCDQVLNDAHHLLSALKEPTVETIQHINKLTADISRKSEGLDVLFRPLYAMKKEKTEDKFAHLIEYIIQGVHIFNTFRKR
jgi:uncharacterized protein YoxC